MKLPTVPVVKDSEPGFDEKLRIWSGGRACPLFHEDVSIGRAGLFMMLTNPQKVIQVCASTGEKLTCEEMAQLGLRAAQNFKHRLCLGQEDVVGLVASDSTFLAPVVLGAFLFGGTISPLCAKYDEGIVKAVFGLTKPKVVFCDVDAYEKVVRSLDDIDLDAKIYTLKGRIRGVPYVQNIFQELDEVQDFMPAVLRNGGKQTAAILPTSGTTGIPKAVCISHYQLLGRSDLNSFMKPDDVLFTFSTLHWITGLIMMVQSFVGCQTQIITDQPFSAGYFLELIEKHRISQVIIPPAYANLIAQCPDLSWRDLSSIRNIMMGGAPMLLSACKVLSQYLKENAIGEAYGLSEIGGLTSVNWTSLKKPHSVGRLFPNVKAKVLSDDGRRLGIGEVGEIHLWHTAKWIGYLGNEAQTRHIMNRNGWIRTGDMGYFDKDGFLYICGRQKDILRHRHFLIHPREIEAVISQIPGVVEVCVFGIPDHIEEDLPTAAIIKSPDCALTASDVCDSVSKCLPDRMHLRGGVFFLKDLPKTSSGKVQRHKLLAIVEEMLR